MAHHVARTVIGF